MKPRKRTLKKKIIKIKIKEKRMRGKRKIENEWRGKGETNEEWRGGRNKEVMGVENGASHGLREEIGRGGGKERSEAM